MIHMKAIKTGQPSTQGALCSIFIIVFTLVSQCTADCDGVSGVLTCLEITDGTVFAVGASVTLTISTSLTPINGHTYTWRLDGADVVRVQFQSGGFVPFPEAAYSSRVVHRSASVGSSWTLNLTISSLLESEADASITVLSPLASISNAVVLKVKYCDPTFFEPDATALNGTNELRFNDFVLSSCKTSLGYIANTFGAICGADATWSPGSHPCELVNCSVVQGGVNVDYDRGVTVAAFNESETARCQVGYSNANDPQTLLCNASGADLVFNLACGCTPCPGLDDGEKAAIGLSCVYIISVLILIILLFLISKEKPTVEKVRSESTPDSMRITWKSRTLTRQLRAKWSLVSPSVTVSQLDAVKNGSIRVSWAGDRDAKNYLVYIIENWQFKGEPKVVTENKYIHEHPGESEYIFVVIAVDKNGSLGDPKACTVRKKPEVEKIRSESSADSIRVTWKSWNRTHQLTTKWSPGSSLTISQLDAVRNGNIRVSWTELSGVEEYLVYIIKNKQFMEDPVPKTGNEYILENPEESEYIFIVIALNMNGFLGDPKACTVPLVPEEKPKVEKVRWPSPDEVLCILACVVCTLAGVLGTLGVFSLLLEIAGIVLLTIPLDCPCGTCDPCSLYGSDYGGIALCILGILAVWGLCCWVICKAVKEPDKKSEPEAVRMMERNQ